MTDGGARAGRGVRIALAAMVTVMSVGMLELAVRIAGHADENGTFYVRRLPALPMRLPVAQLEAAVKAYRASDRTLFVHDAMLGWKPRAGAQNELYAYNAQALRAGAPDASVPPDDPRTLRIAVFGDSFAHGSEVPFDDSWGAQLQRLLDRPDRPAHVLNFGVPGYGMDQAFLRWDREGRAYEPDVVVFGLQVENAGRNLNLLRVLYDSADLPFAKPRFVENGSDLDLINVPVPSPEQVLQIVRTLDDWPLLDYERYYEPDRYRSRPWRYSRLAGLVEALAAGAVRGQVGELPEEQRRLAHRIVERFARSVEEAGARFLVVHFPRRTDLEAAREGGQLPNAGFIAEVERFAPVVRIDGVLLERAGGGDLDPLFSPGGHYSADGYTLLARAVAERLRADVAPMARRDRTERIEP